MIEWLRVPPAMIRPSDKRNKHHCRVHRVREADCQNNIVQREIGTTTVPFISVKKKQFFNLNGLGESDQRPGSVT